MTIRPTDRARSRAERPGVAREVQDSGPAVPARRRDLAAWSSMRASLASVVGLCLSTRPSTVLRRVGAVVVDSLDRVKWGGLRSHVRREILEAGHPPLADADASSTVVGVPDAARVGAALNHRPPGDVCAVQWVPGQADATLPVLNGAAAGCGAALEAVAGHDRFCAAVTAATPEVVAAFSLSPRLDDEVAEPAAGQVNKVRAGAWDRIQAGHRTLHQRFGVSGLGARSQRASGPLNSRQLYLRAFAVAVLVAVALRVTLSAATLTVCASGCSYTTIQAAVNELQLLPGSANEPVGAMAYLE